MYNFRVDITGISFEKKLRGWAKIGSLLQIKSVACLPLVSPSNTCSGCVLLGFAHAGVWDAPDKQLCLQLTAIVSQHHTNFQAMDSDDSNDIDAHFIRGPVCISSLVIQLSK